LQLTGIDSGTARGIRSDTFTATDSFYCAFRWRIDTEPTGSGPAIQFLDSDGVVASYLSYSDVNNRLSTYHGERSVASTTDLSVDTTYYIWFEYEKNTGGAEYNGVSRLYISTTRTKPSASVNDAIGRSEADITSITLVNTRSCVTVFDQVIWDDEPIGDLDE
jgi:hypothetical protein